ncbi:MAG: hypothetical protein KDA80_14155 [Planctomycetaceae bacterium]|nr:hypothetical protein [Planctomycetaceae bacterium]
MSRMIAVASFMAGLLSMGLVFAESENPTQGVSLEFPCEKPAAVQVEVRFLTVSPALLEELRIDGPRQTVDPPLELGFPQIEKMEMEVEETGIRLANATQIVERQQPIVAKRLSSEELSSLLKASQEDRRSSILSAPKVLLKDGETGEINSHVMRPFVTGLQNGEDSPTPRIREIAEGSTVTARCQVISERQVRLDLRLQLADISDVQNIPVGIGAERIQLPEVTRVDVELASRLTFGESLMIWLPTPAPKPTRESLGTRLRNLATRKPEQTDATIVVLVNCWPR